MNPGWWIATNLIAIFAGAMIHWFTTKDNCKKCGIIELKQEIERQGKLIRALAERAGITVKDQLEIERA